MKNAVTRTEHSGSVSFTFTSMPQNAADVRELLDVYPLNNKYNTAALFIAALVRYVENPEDGVNMIDALKGPKPLSTMDKAFLKDRFSDKKYLAKSYFEGAKPENGYEPEKPWELVIYDDPMSPPEGYSYVNIKSSGSENPRRIVMRKKDSEHFLWEYNGALLSIHLPKEEDPWI